MSIKQLHSIVTQASLFYLSWCSAAIAQSDSPLPSPPQLRETHVNAEEITFPLQLPDEPAEKIVQSESSQPIARENRLREKIKPPTKIAQNLPPPGTADNTATTPGNAATSLHALFSNTASNPAHTIPFSQRFYVSDSANQGAGQYDFFPGTITICHQ
jgi:hypothetical protein